MRRLRIAAEYPKSKDIEIAEIDVREDLVRASAIVEMVKRLVPEMPRF